MIKILSAAQMRELDSFTIEHEPIASIDLMERASREFVTWFVQHFDVSKKTGIICGTGNNGGDGLAIGRMLLEWGYPVTIWVVRGNKESEDFKINFNRLSSQTQIFDVSAPPDQGLFNDCDVLVDAIFGSGLARPVEGISAQVIRCINASNAAVIAVDMPSGLRADEPSSGEIVRADYTLTFQLPKLSLMFPQSHEYTGEFRVLDIRLSREKIKNTECSHYLLTAKDCKRMLRPRSKFDHKGTFGHALIIAGSYGKMGAAVLSARAALRAGAGLVSLHVPKSGYAIVQTAVPEAMAQVDSSEHVVTEVENLEKFSTLGIGPALGQQEKTVRALENIFHSYSKPVVVDADALNILAHNPQMRQQLPKGSILTPHPKEFERLAGKWRDDFDRLQRLRALANETGCIVILKGAFTTIAEPNGGVYFNPTGNPGMATGGTGDVLTGILTGLMAQFYSPIETAVLGVFLHGLAGDIAVAEKGADSLIASDLIEFLPKAFKKISGE